MTGGRRRWLRRLASSVRVRVTLLAAGAFALTLLVASYLLLRSLENVLTEDIRQADEAVLAVEADLLSEEGIPPDAVIEEREGELTGAWLGDTGQPFVMSREWGDSGTDLEPRGGVQGPADAADVLLDVADVDSYDNVLITELHTEDGVLLTFSPLGEVFATIDSTRALLWRVGPVLVAFVAGLAWLLAGRALRPVRSMTSRVAAIESESLHERVPEPVSGDEIARLARTMNQMLGRLERASETSRRLVSDASHELRTPVAVMRTELEVAQRDAANDWSSTSDVLLDELDRLQHLVDDLLLLARGDERGLARDDVDLGDLIGEVTARRRRLSVSFEHSPDGRVVGDPLALTRAFDHLVTNAVRSATERVMVTIEPGDDGEVAVHVDDDGPGIPERQRADVVRRFVRLDEGRARDQGGAGLGLAVASDVAAGHGGRLEITDSPLGGARVTIVMPTPPSVESCT